MQYHRSIISLFYELILFFFEPASEKRKFESQLLASKVSLGGSDFLSDQLVSFHRHVLNQNNLIFLLLIQRINHFRTIRILYTQIQELKSKSNIIR
jgi:hypothetical protein